MKSIAVMRILVGVLALLGACSQVAALDCNYYGDRAVTWVGEKYFIKSVPVKTKAIDIENRCCAACVATKGCREFFVDFVYTAATKTYSGQCALWKVGAAKKPWNEKCIAGVKSPCRHSYGWVS